MAKNGNEHVKELLLRDYRYRAEGMGRSEQSGETRLSFFIGLITFCATTIGAGYSGLGKVQGLGIAEMHAVAFATALALLAIGAVILGRMITRNENTDLAKEQLDLIRRIFKQQFDKDGTLAHYNLFPKSDGRKFGSLTDLVSVVNAFLAGAVVLFGFFAAHAPLALAAGFSLAAFVFAIRLQHNYVRRRTQDYKKRQVAYFKSTHAGGVVYSAEGGALRYLIVSPKDPDKNEWVLPKGHIDLGEDPRDTAVREVAEESGIAASVVGELPSVEFSLKNSAKPIRARFFLMEKTGVAPVRQKKDQRRIDWVSRDEALERLSFDEARALVRRADKMISQ